MAKLRIGEVAPQFELEGTGSKTYRLKDYLGTGVMLAFYPGDFTPSVPGSSAPTAMTATGWRGSASR